MCGLVGGIGLDTNSDWNNFELMFMLNVLRGSHSSGTISAYEKEEMVDGKKVTNKYYSHRKSILPSSAYVHDEEFEATMSNKPIFIAGHSRYATKGKINEKNAHPFEVGKVIGMHNGTINGSFEGFAKYDTDSEALMALIGKKGLTAALDVVHKEAWNVAYALVYYHKADASVNIIRNPDRPLYLAGHKKKEGKMFWNSDKTAMEFSLAKSRLDDEYDIVDLKPYTYIKMYPFKAAAERVEIHEDYYKPAVRTYSWPIHDHSKARNKGGNGGFYRGGNYYNGRDSWGDWSGMDDWDYGTKSIEAERKEEDKKDSPFKIDDWEAITVGKIYTTAKELSKHLNRGCMVCSQPAFITNREPKMEFWRNTITDFVCEDCLKPSNRETLEMQYGIYQTELTKPEFVMGNQKKA